MQPDVSQPCTKRTKTVEYASSIIKSQRQVEMMEAKYS